MCSHEQNRDLIANVRSAMYNWRNTGVATALNEVFTTDAEVHLAYPFETLNGPNELFETAFVPLSTAISGLERRDYISIAGTDPFGADWVGCAGHYAGTWTSSFLGIPPTNKPVLMRFHEFFRMVEGQVIEMQSLWDIPQLMVQAQVWPLRPQLGGTLPAPAPATGDGLRNGLRDEQEAAASAAVVVGMLRDMVKHPPEPVEAMRLEHWWHPNFGWYGPAGIGSSRGIDGFRQHHQIPFLDSFPDRRGGYDNDNHFFADGPYVGETAWPGMFATHQGNGFLGIEATGAEITMRSLDFWRIEEGRIRENWVLVDMLDLLKQLGIDILNLVAMAAIEGDTE